MNLGKSAIQSISRQKKLNTKSSTDAKIVGAENTSNFILWNKLSWDSKYVSLIITSYYRITSTVSYWEMFGDNSSINHNHFIKFANIFDITYWEGRFIHWLMPKFGNDPRLHVKTSTGKTFPKFPYVDHGTLICVFPIYCDNRSVLDALKIDG